MGPKKRKSASFLSLSRQGLGTVYVLDNSGSDSAALKLREVVDPPCIKAK